MNDILFYLVILITNIIQGITGFAGTVLAMPFSLRLVGMDVAVPVLNLFGFLSGIYVFLGNRESLDKKVLLKVLSVMGPFVIAGLFIRKFLSGNVQLLYYILGVIVILFSLQGLIKALRKKETDAGKEVVTSRDTPFMNLLLLLAGVVHGMYVCGGPILISYMTGRLKDKSAFRATISTIWIFLNGVILLSHVATGSFTGQVLKSSLIALPFLLLGMFIGSLLYKRMSQRFFVNLTYVLLFISGLSLFFK